MKKVPAMKESFGCILKSIVQAKSEGVSGVVVGEVKPNKTWAFLKLDQIFHWLPAAMLDGESKRVLDKLKIAGHSARIRFAWDSMCVVATPCIYVDL